MARLTGKPEFVFIGTVLRPGAALSGRCEPDPET